MAKYGREGHRARIRQSYFANGADGMSDVHLMELYLSLLIPRRDVKPIAYALFNKFDKLERIFSASYDELVSVDGVGDNTAVAIMLYNDLLNRVDSAEHDNYLQKEIRMGYAKSFVFGTEKYSAAFVGADGELLDSFEFDALDGIAKSFVLESAVKHNCLAVFVLRFGTKSILGDDIAFVTELKRLLKTMGVALLDYIAVGIDECVSINDTEHFKLLEN